MSRALLSVAILAMNPETKALLSRAAGQGYLEYRDSEHPTEEQYREFLNSVSDGERNEAEHETRVLRYKDRNEGGTFLQAITLESMALLEPDMDAWHPTYHPTEAGRQLAQVLADMEKECQPVEQVLDIRMMLALAPEDKEVLVRVGDEPCQLWRCPKAVIVLSNLLVEGLVFRNEAGFQLTNFGRRIYEHLRQ